MKRKASSKGWSKNSLDRYQAYHCHSIRCSSAKEHAKEASVPRHANISTISEVLLVHFLTFHYSQVGAILKHEHAFNNVTIQSKYSPTESQR